MNIDHTQLYYENGMLEQDKNMLRELAKGVQDVLKRKQQELWGSAKRATKTCSIVRTAFAKWAEAYDKYTGIDTYKSSEWTNAQRDIGDTLQILNAIFELDAVETQHGPSINGLAYNMTTFGRNDIIYVHYDRFFSGVGDRIEDIQIVPPTASSENVPLTGIVYHEGKDMQSGHYMGTILCREDRRSSGGGGGEVWYDYDDNLDSDADRWSKSSGKDAMKIQEDNDKAKLVVGAMYMKAAI